MRLVKKYIQITLMLISNKAFNKIKLIIFGFTLLSIFDFIGVILLGSVGTIAYRVLNDDTKPSRIETILDGTLPINVNIYTLAFLLTIVAILFLAFKTILTAYFNYKLISF